MVFVYSLTRRRWRQKSIDKQTRVATRFDKRLFLGASLFRRSVPRKRGTRRLSISKCPDRFHSDCLMSRNSTRRGNRLHKRSGRILAQLARQKSLGIVGGRGGAIDEWSMFIGEYFIYGKPQRGNRKNLLNFFVVLLKVIF